MSCDQCGGYDNPEELDARYMRHHDECRCIRCEWCGDVVGNWLDSPEGVAPACRPCFLEHANWIVGGDRMTRILGGVFGVEIFKEGEHVLCRLLSEDDEYWFPHIEGSGTFSPFWIPDLIAVLEQAQANPEVKASIEETMRILQEQAKGRNG